jgi:hypothetical protein
LEESMMGKSKLWRPRRPTLEEYFWRKVDKNGPIPKHRPNLGKCWVWVDRAGRPVRSKYGKATFGKISAGAHRVAFFLKHGRWPKPQACHRCDNTRCVRPSHLFEGTQKVNIKDAIRKGRMWWKTDRRTKVAASIGLGRSQLNRLALLAAKALRKDGYTYRQIASELDVHVVTVWRYLTAKS